MVGVPGVYGWDGPRSPDPHPEVPVEPWIWWLIPVGGFFPLASLFLGGAPIEFRGGGAFRHVLGLLLSWALTIGVWWGVRAALTGALGPVAAVVLAAVVAFALIPLWCRIGFRIAGVKLVGGTFARGPLNSGAQAHG